MKNFEKRLKVLEADVNLSPGGCSCCQARAAMTEAEIDARLKVLIEVLEGKRELAPSDLPPSSPDCPKCQGRMAEIAALSAEQVDARLAELLPLLKESIGKRRS